MAGGTLGNASGCGRQPLNESTGTAGFKRIEEGVVHDLFTGQPAHHGCQYHPRMYGAHVDTTDGWQVADDGEAIHGNEAKLHVGDWRPEWAKW